MSSLGYLYQQADPSAEADMGINPNTPPAYPANTYAYLPQTQKLTMLTFDPTRPECC